MAGTTQDFVMRLEMICDSTLYAYLSRIADTAEKRQYLDFSCTAARVYAGCHDVRMSHETLTGFDLFLEHLQNLADSGFNLRPADSGPCPFRLLLLASMDNMSSLWGYLWGFRLNPERSGEFHYDIKMWSTVGGTLCMRYLRKLSDSR